MAEHRWHTSGDEMLRYLAKAYQVRGVVHWPTAISGTAALAGEIALLAHETKLPRSGRVKSAPTIDYIHDGKASSACLWGYTAMVAEQAFGLGREALPDYEEVVMRVVSGPLPESYSYPAIMIRAALAPRENPRNAGARYRRAIHEIAQHHQLHLTETPYALTTAAMKMIGYAHTLGAQEMIRLFLETLVASSRAVPLEAPMQDPAFGQVGAILQSGHGADLRPPLPGADSYDPWADLPEESARASDALGFLQTG